MDQSILTWYQIFRPKTYTKIPVCGFKSFEENLSGTLKHVS